MNKNIDLVQRLLDVAQWFDDAGNKPGVTFAHLVEAAQEIVALGHIDRKLLNDHGYLDLDIETVGIPPKPKLNDW